MAPPPPPDEDLSAPEPPPLRPRRGPPSPAARTPDEAVSGAGGAGEPDPGGLGAAETADEVPETRSQGTPGGSREKGGRANRAPSINRLAASLIKTFYS
ncbi:Structural Maintenance Of Chromosomes Protein 4 [Manis pentadactyla]|nr:Structural Maintenance Of Chromosomes Protein 4 [Manis pentadactyla]